MTVVTVYEWSDDLAVEHGPVAGRVDLAAATRFDDLWDDVLQCSRATGLRDYRETVYLTHELGPVQRCWWKEPAGERFVTMDRHDAFRWLVSQGYGESAREVFVEWATYEDAEAVALRVVRAVLTEPRDPHPLPSATASVQIHNLMYVLIEERGLSGVENLVEVLARHVVRGLRTSAKDGGQASVEAALLDEEFDQLVFNNFQHLS